MNKPDYTQTVFAASPLAMDADSILQSMLDHLTHTIAKNTRTATHRDWYHALAHAVRDRLAERWLATSSHYQQQNTRQIYYLSIEYLPGRMLTSSILNLDLQDACRTALSKAGLSFEEICAIESDPALGNGGLGRLAACFLDSMASLGLPGYGYGIRYEFGLFVQHLRDGCQIEQPDNWLADDNIHEFSCTDARYQVSFGGFATEYINERGEHVHSWEAAEHVIALACDVPVPGYRNGTVNTLRLWTARSASDLDLQSFNQGDYVRAMEGKTRAEILSKVLYPGDATVVGQALRLRQEYFLVSASIQDIIHRFHRQNEDIHILADKVVIQLNDTHPVLAIPELMRILLDHYCLSWCDAWGITTRTFAYTNHTLLPEALEKWPVSLFEKLLPRHLQIIYSINHIFLEEVRHKKSGDVDILRRMSLIGEDGEKHVRMGHLAVVGSHCVNGVAALHTALMKSTVFSDFAQFWPERFVNKTNGITPRRWLKEANPLLSNLISEYIGDQWVTDLSQLQQLTSLATDKTFCDRFHAIKQQNKQRLADYIKSRTGIEVRTDSLFDVHIKRLHEYKRQLLNVLHIITRYNQLRDQPTMDCVPRTFIFAGKAAPDYVTAKLIIRLINAVADVIDHDPLVSSHLKVIFLPNYDVSVATRIIPAADLSEQISTAGMEASGTGNMKLALNGALTIGTLDGANIEIRDQVGEDNIFIFGLTAEAVIDLRGHGYNPRHYYQTRPTLQRVLDMISSGYFSPDDPHCFKPIVEELIDGDQFMLLADYDSYVSCQQTVDDRYRDPADWTRRAVLNTANMGYFSSDRTVREYAEDIWHIEPCSLP